MGWPLLAGAALATAGTGVTMAGQASARDEMEKTAQAEYLRQKGYQGKSKDIYENSLAEATPQKTEGNIEAGKQKALEAYQRLQQQPQAATASPIKTDDTTVGRQQAYRSMMNAPAAQLQGYPQMDLMNRIKNLQANSLLQAQMANAQRSAQVLPLEMQQASHAGDTMGGIGSILSLLGSGVGLYGAMAPAAGAASAGTTASNMGLPGSTVGANGAFYGSTATVPQAATNSFLSPQLAYLMINQMGQFAPKRQSYTNLWNQTPYLQ